MEEDDMEEDGMEQNGIEQDCIEENGISRHKRSASKSREIIAGCTAKSMRRGATKRPTVDDMTIFKWLDQIQTPGGGERAGLGQFPWMALLGYRQNHWDFIEYLCGGTIITERYVLTAAHCLAIGTNHDIVHVRLGENDLSTDKDCRSKNGVTVCSDDPVDVPVINYFGHPNYNPQTLKNDIALVKLKERINFTEFIQPICLPFERNVENSDLTGKNLIVSGWGKTDSRKLGGSPVLQFATVTVWNHNDCQQVVPPEVQPITTGQLCANGKKEDACKGDSGGPLINQTLDIDGELRNFQIGVVSFASTLTCGIAELPPIYTRVDKYLEWIANNVE